MGSSCWVARSRGAAAFGLATRVFQARVVQKTHRSELWNATENCWTCLGTINKIDILYLSKSFSNNCWS